MEDWGKKKEESRGWIERTSHRECSHGCLLLHHSEAARLIHLVEDVEAGPSSS